MSQRSSLSPGIQDSVVALLAEGTPVRAIARRYALSHSQVQNLAKRLAEIDVTHVNALRRGLPGLQTTLSAAMAAKAMDILDEDPATAVKLAFGSKLSIEATRLSQPNSEAPGRVVLNVIGGQVLVATTPAPPALPDVIESEKAEVVSENPVTDVTVVTDSDLDFAVDP